VVPPKPARPIMIVIGGPPGSGKSTFFPIGALGVDAFSIDDRCAQIFGSYRAIPPALRKAVSRECERFVGEHIDRGRSSSALKPVGMQHRRPRSEPYTPPPLATLPRRFESLIAAESSTRPRRGSVLGWSRVRPEAGLR
jgi:hypothetical protein